MKVKELREILVRLQELGQVLMTGKWDGEPTNKRLGTLGHLGAALEAFDDLEVEKFTEFLYRCKQYEETGIVPRKSSRAAPKPPVISEEVVTPWVARLETLQRNISATAVSYQEIDEVCKSLQKLKKDFIAEIARRLGISIDPRDKKDLIVEKLRSHLREIKATFERTAF